MIKHTKIFSADRQVQEVVWVRREEFEDNKKQRKILRFKTETEIEEYEQELQQHKDKDKLPIVYSPEYAAHFAKLEKLHPFDAHKGKHVAKHLIKKELLPPGRFYEPHEISKEELLRVHTAKYLRGLKWSIKAAAIAEIPILALLPNNLVQNSYLKPMRFQTAGSIMAGKLALEYGWAINLGGGFHHCCSYKGGGFCPYADITLLIERIFSEESYIKNIMIIDLDAHQGNGHERDFMDNAYVYIMDMYNMCIYPRDHEAKLAIRYAVELRPRIKDESYLKFLKKGLNYVFKEFQPQLVVYNAGTDILEGDPLGYMCITPEGVMERDRIVFATCRSKHIPIVMLLSGGYLSSSAKVIADSIENLKLHGLLQNIN